MSKLEQIRALVEADMKQVDEAILSNLHSKIEQIQEIGHHITGSGGKRLRPLTLLLVAKACGYEGEEHAKLAAIIEFIHTATLLHDDVVDRSLLRRGRQTANAVWGDQASVLVGDFVYSRSFQMMISLNSLPIMDILANTTNTIAEGEVLQMLNRHNTSATEADYMEVIRCKTAVLFSAAAKLGALIAGQNRQIIEHLGQFGFHLGIAFQLIDDALDYSANSEELGKNIGDDLAEGKPTLPLIYILENGTEMDRAIISEAIESSSIENLAAVQQILANMGAIDYVYHKAKEQGTLAKAALEILPNTFYRKALETLVDFALERRY